MVQFDQKGFNEECGLRVREYRRIHDLTQETLAQRLGLTRAAVANIESGRQRVAADVLWRAACVFNVPVWRLMPQRA
jgi:transcriptional regulator with XRE-family HTH domain